MCVRTYVRMHTLPTWFDHGLMVRKDVSNFHKVLGVHQVPDVVTNDINLPDERQGAGGEGGEKVQSAKCRSYPLSCTCMSVQTVASSSSSPSHSPLTLFPHPSPLVPFPHSSPLTPLPHHLPPHSSPSHYRLPPHRPALPSLLTPHPHLLESQVV